MDVATSSGLAAVAAAAFEAANAQMPGMGQLAPEEVRLCAVCNDQARGRHYGIYRYIFFVLKKNSSSMKRME